MSTSPRLAHALLEQIRATTSPWSGDSISDRSFIGGDSEERAREISRRLLPDDAMGADLANVPGVGEMWNALATELVTAARELELPAMQMANLPDMVVVASLDTHLVNAASYALEDGSALIVLNDALVTLVYETSRILASLVTIPNQAEPDTTTEDAQGALRAVLDWIRLSGRVNGVDLLLDGTARLRIAGEICFAVEEFVIAHEVAHLVLGHHAGCMGSRHLLIEVPSPSVNRPEPDFQTEEAMADYVGLVLMLQARAKRDGIRGDHQFAMDATRAFFRLQAEIEEIVVAQSFPTPLRLEHDRTHPPATARTAQLRHMVQAYVGNGAEAWKRTDGLTTALDLLLDEKEDVVARETAAADAARDALHRYSQVPVPDYAAFMAAMAEETQRFRQPVVLAALASAFVSHEHEMEQLMRDADEDLADFSIRHYQQFKLILSYYRNLQSPVQQAFAEMYERAGGTNPGFLLA